MRTGQLGVKRAGAIPALPGVQYSQCDVMSYPVDEMMIWGSAR